MNNKEYIEGVLVTETRDFGPVKERLQSTETVRLLHGAMGLSTEANELVDQMKKVIFYGKDVDKVNLKEEVGDVLWYCAVILDTLGVSFEEAMQTNIDKLRKRYGDKFTEEAAINRNVEEERIILEK